MNRCCAPRSASESLYVALPLSTTMSCHLDAEMYRTLMYDLGLGHALYEPGPSKYDHIRVGDVGYVYNGTFKRLFNACFEEDDQANQDSTLPQPYQPLEPRYRGVSGDRRLDAGIS